MPKTHLIIARLAFGAALTLTDPVLAAPATYTLDPAHTAVTWHVNHFGFSTPSGKFMSINGTLLLDEANPTASKLTVTVPIASMDSGVAKLDEHLKSADFFDAAQFPTAAFTSTNVKLTGKDTAEVDGNLTLHGVTKPLTLNVTLNKIGTNMMQKPTAGFSATAMLKRSDFGITKYAPMLGDDVKLDIESEANQPAPAAPQQ